MTMKKLITLTSFALMFTGANMITVNADPLAKENFSANVALATDYMYRGVSQTNNSPAISGGFDWGYNGFYIGTWASNVNFTDNTAVEIDYYGGYGGEFANGTAYDFGGLYYHYPSDGNPQPEQEFFEVYGSLSHTFAGDFEPTIGVDFAWSPDFYLETGDGLLTGISGGLTLGYGVGLSAAVHWQDIEKGDSYLFYSVGLSKDVSIFTFDLTYYDTDSTPSNRLNDGRAVFTISSSF